MTIEPLFYELALVLIVACLFAIGITIVLVVDYFLGD